MKKGFTLVELLAVLVILATIMLIIIPIVQNTIDEAEESANLKSAEFYLRAVEVAIKTDRLSNTRVPNGTYDIMKNGNLCIGTYNKSSNICTGHELEVDVINPPKGGTITIENNLATDYTITLDNDEIVTNLKPTDPESTDASCFDYIDNYEYDVNSNTCMAVFGDQLNHYFDEDAADNICNNDQTFGDLIVLANYVGVSVENLETYGVIENKKTTGTITITGYKCGGLEENEDVIRDVVIPNKIDNKIVTSIGVVAFKENQLTSVVIPNNIATIGFAAFSDNQLTSVELPNGVTIIGVQAFYKNQLESVTLGNSVTTIGEYAFEENQLTSVTIPNSVQTIGFAAFSYNQLTSVEIPNSVKTIEQSAFHDNQLTNIIIPNSVTSIGSYAFSSNNLTSVTIPNSVTTIGQGAFRYNKLKTVTIGSGITSIGNRAFVRGTDTDSNTGITYGPNALENVYINRNQSDVTLGEDVFGWASGYEGNIHWNSTGPTN